MPDFFSTKFSHYFDAYQSRLPVGIGTGCLLEIGVHQGGSLQYWSRKYPNAVIAGVDIDPRCKGAEGGNIRVFTGSQSDKKFLWSVTAQLPDIDIIIDDGSHRPNHQIASFEALWPSLKVGGVYVVEDLIVGYQKKWRIAASVFGTFDFRWFINTLIDKMHTDPHCNIASVHFEPWMVFITKGATSWKQKTMGTDDCRIEKTT
jgi:hypothetical protein